MMTMQRNTARSRTPAWHARRQFVATSLATSSLVAGFAIATACGGQGTGELATDSDELVTRYRDAANITIPDNDATGISRSLLVDEGWDVVSSLRVKVKIRHSYRGDLRVTLTSPAGTEAVLHDHQGGAADNLELTTRVRDFDGERASGHWSLRVVDDAEDDTGKLQAWALAIDHVPGVSPCERVECDEGEHCELRPVYCIRAPCPPQPQCVPDAEPNPCASIRCAGGYHCEPQIVQCVRAPCPPIGQCVPNRCDDDDCPRPRPGAPNYLCEDGSTGGPVCERGRTGGNCVWNIRECPSAPEPGPFCGTRGNEVYCASGEYCHYTESQTCGWADAQGECRAKPEICTQDCPEVCGCDGQTYCNACIANSAGTSVLHDGRCN